ncbi:MAG: hypothetical protein KC550_00360 [Nanoarchaeota archaeon]|nr:hypothetical protein [Nanoarchaeota archaeon]
MGLSERTMKGVAVGSILGLVSGVIGYRVHGNAFEIIEKPAVIEYIKKLKM